MAALVRGDAAGMAEFGGFYGEAVDKLGPLLGGDRRAWLIRLSGEPVGFLDADCEGSRVGLAYFVVAAQRRRGVARLAVVRLLSLELWGDEAVYTVATSPRNAASIGVARASGFHPVGRNEYGEEVWEHRSPESRFGRAASDD